MALKVMQIGGTFKGGGPGTTTALVHNALLNNGFNSIVCQILSEVDDEKVITVSGKYDVLFWKVLRRLKLNLSQFEFVRTIRIIKTIKKEKPDVINLRVLHHGLINYSKLLKFLIKYNKPVIVTLHDMWYVTGGCYHFIDVACDGYKNGCKNCPKNRNKLDCFKFETYKHLYTKKKLFEKIENLSVVCVSNWVKSNLEGTIFEDKECVVIPNAVDSSVFYPRERTAPNDKKIVFGVANFWTKEKGIFDFIELAKKLDSNYQVVLAGNIPETILEEVLKANIISLGKITDRNKLAQLFSDCDVFVQLSYQETFGNVVLEAAACGKKTIGYDITAIPEVLKEVNGIISPAGDVDAVLEAVKTVCEKEENLTNEEINKIHSDFSKEKLCERHINLYKKVAGSDKNRTIS